METKRFDIEKINEDYDAAWHYFYYFDRLSELEKDDVHHINSFVAYVEYLEDLNNKLRKQTTRQ